MHEVSIFIESTWRGPARRDGVAMWLVECKRGERLDTRQGFVHVKEGTETQGNLMAMINALHILKKPCKALVFTKCSHILISMQQEWPKEWQENGWIGAKGKPVKNAELWKMLIEKGKRHTYTLKDDHHEYENIMQSDLRKELESWKNTEP